jgi:hypothetical protein
MSVQISWVNPEQTAILLIYSSDWTWNDYYSSREQRHAMLSGVNHKVDVIMVFQTGKYHLPPNSLSNLGRIWQKRHPNLGRVYLVGLGPVLKALSNVFFKVYPGAASRTCIVDTLEEALRMAGNKLDLVGVA